MCNGTSISDDVANGRTYFNVFGLRIGNGSNLQNIGIDTEFTIKVREQRLRFVLLCANTKVSLADPCAIKTQFIGRPYLTKQIIV